MQYKFIFVLMTLFILIGCKERIIHDLSEAEANRLVSHFHDHGLEVGKERLPEGTWAISIPKAKAAEAIVLLDQSRITRRSRTVPLKQSGFLASREQQQLEYARLLAYDIEQTLLTIDGVFEARVHLHFPAQDPILGARNDNGETGTASVLLVASTTINVPSLEVAKVVSGASGISADKVAVLVTAPTMHSANELTETITRSAEVRSTMAPEWIEMLSSTSIISILALFVFAIGLNFAMRSLPERVKRRLCFFKNRSATSIVQPKTIELATQNGPASAEHEFHKLMQRVREAV